MSLGWKIFVGSIAVVGGFTYYLLRKKKSLTFENYCERIIVVASRHLNELVDVSKAVLIIKQSNEELIIPLLYVRYKSGKLTKTEFKKNYYPLKQCPDNIRNEMLQKGEYIIHKF